MRILYFIVIFFVANDGVANSKFQEYLKNKNNKFEQFQIQKNTEFEAYRQQKLDEFDQYRQQIMQDWVVPDQTSIEEEVIYTEDLQTRIKINAVTRTVKIEHLTDEKVEPNAVYQSLSNDPNTKLIIDNLDMASENSGARLLTTDSVDLVEQPTEAEAKRVVNKQIIAHKEQSLAQVGIENSQSDKASIIETTNTRTIKAEQQFEQNKLNNPSYKNIQEQVIQLPDKFEYFQVQKYIPFYIEQSTATDINLSLLLAISQAESSFISDAESHIPAFGLMQIVPHTAGLDVANKVLYESQPTREILIEPEKNIIYGSSYLQLLTTQYLSGIEHPLSRQYCITAAYNTGAGNVAKVFNSDRSMKLVPAVQKINQLAPQEVYQTLIDELPYSETQKYLIKVSKLVTRYQVQTQQWNLSNKDINDE